MNLHHCGRYGQRTTHKRSTTFRFHGRQRFNDLLLCYGFHQGLRRNRTYIVHYKTTYRPVCHFSTRKFGKLESGLGDPSLSVLFGHGAGFEPARFLYLRNHFIGVARLLAPSGFVHSPTRAIFIRNNSQFREFGKWL